VELGGRALNVPGVASGRVQVHEFESALLRGNPLSDPTTRRVPVYLPPGYERETTRRYPVLYALAGFTGSGLSYVAYDWYAPTLPERLDRMIANGTPPVVVVMVDGMTAVGGNQYVDSPGVGPWASHVVRELVPWAERTFRLLPGREHRGVFGKSSGGFGALSMGLDHADSFAAVASHSGDCGFEGCYGPDFPKAVDGLAAEGGLAEFLRKLRARAWPKFPPHLHATLNTVAMAHFYSPRKDAPSGIDLPMDEETGARRRDVWERWLAWDPVERAPAKAAALRSLRLLWFDCGRKDDFFIHHGARGLAAALRRSGVPHVHEEYDDDHRGVGYRHEVSIPVLVRALA
jgi:enterochelin esterase family protein